mmetsp:Transcript_24563/g.77880  ORF Transcript_24563/g.77880 Transcript_24563/m.77880 type:complete len:319 (-) Transcript_24563:21-977(-)
MRMCMHMYTCACPCVCACACQPSSVRASPERYAASPSGDSAACAPTPPRAPAPSPANCATGPKALPRSLTAPPSSSGTASPPTVRESSFRAGEAEACMEPILTTQKNHHENNHQCKSNSLFGVANTRAHRCRAHLWVPFRRIARGTCTHRECDSSAASHKLCRHLESPSTPPRARERGPAPQRLSSQTSRLPHSEPSRSLLGNISEKTSRLPPDPALAPPGSPNQGGACGTRSAERQLVHEAAATRRPAPASSARPQSPRPPLPSPPSLQMLPPPSLLLLLLLLLMPLLLLPPPPPPALGVPTATPLKLHLCLRDAFP